MSEEKKSRWKEQARAAFLKRRSWWIHPRFQARVVLYGLSISGLSLSLTFLALQFFFWRSHHALVEAGVPFDHPMYVFLGQQESMMGAIFVLIFTVSVVLAAAIGLVLSHRVAGPVHRLKVHLLESAAGRAPAPVRFRKDDYFSELAEAYNEELYARGRLKRPGSQPSRDQQEKTAAGRAESGPVQGVQPRLRVLQGGQAATESKDKKIA